MFMLACAQEQELVGLQAVAARSLLRKMCPTYRSILECRGSCHSPAVMPRHCQRVDLSCMHDQQARSPVKYPQIRQLIHLLSKGGAEDPRKHPEAVLFGRDISKVRKCRASEGHHFWLRLRRFRGNKGFILLDLELRASTLFSPCSLKHGSLHVTHATLDC